jgi:hypothetical protein
MSDRSQKIVLLVLGVACSVGAYWAPTSAAIGIGQLGTLLLGWAGFRRPGDAAAAKGEL